MAGRTKRKIVTALWDISQFGNTTLKHIRVDNSQYKMQNYLVHHKTTHGSRADVVNRSQNMTRGCPGCFKKNTKAQGLLLSTQRPIIIIIIIII